MANLRFKALEKATSRVVPRLEPLEEKVSDKFGRNVFDKTKMRKFLSKDAYVGVMDAIERGTVIDRKLADLVASGMKDWAMSRGATHYTHWFQPLNGATAEKHDSFFDVDYEGNVFENFEGKLLAQQEPDASSFPNGGIRDTFEARGYTAWDPASPAFIFNNTLCIPTIFVSYTGEALDFKTPLLRSINAVDKAAVEVCQYFDKNVTKVHSNLGWEQEYFLVDEALFRARPDLVLTGRTLMGHSSSKGQQLDDHYFGSIPHRVGVFMQDLEHEMYLLGVPIKTRHNEVAPNQFECAPIFEEANKAVDHNQLLLAVMKKVARRHHFRALIHEKPFAGINGSGKHNNWSLATNTGVNLLSPGKNPKSNLQFLTFLVNTIKAVHVNQDLFRSSIVSAGNAHRLGANEAPPAIMSVYLGQELTKMLNEIEEKVHNKKMTPDEKTALKLGIGKIPEILLDTTDRNRTSPFAFTGNRFEFRAVGSETNCASPMTALNTAMASQLIQFKKEVDVLIEKDVKKDEAIFQVLRKYIIESKNIRFEGNGYSDEWVKDAAKRGLTNISDVPEALIAGMHSKQTEKVYKETSVLTDKELEARLEILLEFYIMKIQIEARVLGDLAINHILPIAIKYQTALIENVKGLKEIFGDKELEKVAKLQIASIRKISEYKSNIQAKVDEMKAAKEEVNRMNDTKEVAKAYSNKIFPYLDEIRENIDKLELMVDDEMWPLPKYREMLFTR